MIRLPTGCPHTRNCFPFPACAALCYRLIQIDTLLIVLTKRLFQQNILVQFSYMTILLFFYSQFSQFSQFSYNSLTWDSYMRLEGISFPGKEKSDYNCGGNCGTSVFKGFNFRTMESNHLQYQNLFVCCDVKITVLITVSDIALFQASIDVITLHQIISKVSASQHNREKGVKFIFCFCRLYKHDSEVSFL